MARKKSPAASTRTRTRTAKLPGAARHVAHERPQLWAAFQTLGAEVSKAGPLDQHDRRLVHLALAIASGSEGATHSHARRGLAEGLAADELEHVALLAITTIGWSQAIKGLTWVRDVTRSTLDTRGSAPLDP